MSIQANRAADAIAKTTSAQIINGGEPRTSACTPYSATTRYWIGLVQDVATRPSMWLREGARPATDGTHLVPFHRELPSGDNVGAHRSPSQ
jgi:hypothetical protein